MNPGGQKVGQVYVEVEANLAKLSTALNESVGQAAKAGDQIGKSLEGGVAAGVSGATKQIESLGDSLSKVGSSLTSVGTSLSATLTLPIAAVGAAAIKADADIDSLMRGLTAVAGSAQKAAVEFEELREVAKLPGLGLEEAIRGSVSLQAFGFSAKEAKESLMAFGNAIATVGGGKAELDRVVLQLGQMAGAGKVLISDLRPIIQTVPQVSQIIREKLGPEALGEPEKALQKLGLSSRDFITMLVTELGKLPQVTGGIKNDLENMADGVKLALADFGKSLDPLVHSVSDNLVPALQGIVTQFKLLPEGAQSGAIGLGVVLAAIGPVTIAAGTLIRSIGEISTALKVLQATAAAGTIGIGALAIASFGAAALVTASQIQDLKTKYDALASETEKTKIFEMLAAGKTTADLEALGISLEHVKSALAGAAIDGAKFQTTIEGLDITVRRLSDGSASLGKAAQDIVNKLKDEHDAINLARTAFEQLSDAHAHGKATSEQVAAAHAALEAQEKKLAKATGDASASFKELEQNATKVLQALPASYEQFVAAMDQKKIDTPQISQMVRLLDEMHARWKVLPPDVQAYADSLEASIKIQRTFAEEFNKATASASELARKINADAEKTIDTYQRQKAAYAVILDQYQAGTTSITALAMAQEELKRAYDAAYPSAAKAAEAAQGYSVSVENGVRVIREGASALPTFEQALGQTNRTMENGVQVIHSYDVVAQQASGTTRGFASAEQSLGTTVINTSAAFATAANTISQWTKVVNGATVVMSEAEHAAAAASSAISDMSAEFDRSSASINGATTSLAGYMGAIAAMSASPFFGGTGQIDSAVKNVLYHLGFTEIDLSSQEVAGKIGTLSGSVKQNQPVSSGSTNAAGSAGQLADALNEVNSTAQRVTPTIDDLQRALDDLSKQMDSGVSGLQPAFDDLVRQIVSLQTASTEAAVQIQAAAEGVASAALQTAAANAIADFTPAPTPAGAAALPPSILPTVSGGYADRPAGAASVPYGYQAPAATGPTYIIQMPGLQVSSQLMAQQLGEAMTNALRNVAGQRL